MKELKVIGRAEKSSFPELEIFDVPARVDTGAKTSAVWASNILIDPEGKLNFCLFDSHSSYYNGRIIKTKTYTLIVVASSMGNLEKRYKVRLLFKIKGKKIRGSFTLANREQQAYPVLVGRNLLRGKFIVNVKKGKVAYDAERMREKQKYAAFGLKEYKK